MDNFVEQIVVKKTELKDNLKRLAFFSGGMALCLLLLTIGMNIFELMPVFLFLNIGVVWLVWFLFQSTFIEYEYIVTNNELDVDKIIARKRRKRLITIKINQAEDWGEYSDGKGADSSVTVQAHDCGYTNLWYIVTQHDKYGKTTVFFSPNMKVLEVMNKAVPYGLRKKELKEKKADEIEENLENQN
ncbi:MAG: hypothetical protein LBC86_09480 [Oscillospiraceae bacterium]|jgi:hypothetical protein|nr:hypothetical protein [Oscillospiraceae bacterium]